MAAQSVRLAAYAWSLARARANAGAISQSATGRRRDEPVRLASDVWMDENMSITPRKIATCIGGDLSERSLKLGCHNGLPEDRKEHQLQGFFNATASVSEWGKKKMVNYNFDTTDWPLELVPPFMLACGPGRAPSADDIELAHHLGSVMGLLVEIQGPKTVIHSHKVDDGRSGHMSGCVKSVAHDEDITIEQFVERQTH